MWVPNVLVSSPVCVLKYPSVTSFKVSQSTLFKVSQSTPYKVSQSIIFPQRSGPGGLFCVLKFRVNDLVYWASDFCGKIRRSAIVAIGFTCRSNRITFGGQLLLYTYVVGMGGGGVLGNFLVLPLCGFTKSEITAYFLSTSIFNLIFP